MMAAGDRRIVTSVDRYVGDEIKNLSDSDIRNRMKANFDERAETSEWYLDISKKLDEVLNSSSEKSYDELVLELVGSNPSTTDNTTGSPRRRIAEQISAGLLQSEQFKSMKEELFREWDTLRHDEKQDVTLSESGLDDKHLVTLHF